MKNKLLALLLCLGSFSAMAYHSLYLRDPHNWYSAQGNIDSATLSIKPKGAYMECGLYLTFSAKNSYYTNAVYEVQMYFDLPEGAIVTDSWLWVGNQIVRADIRDRGTANMIYEGIVNRRQDPSILYKNSPTQYELRVYPMAHSEKRKVKITYLVPVSWGKSSTSVPLPINILKASANYPALDILSYTDASWHTPRIDGNKPVTFNPVALAPHSHKATIPATTIGGATTLNYLMASPLKNGVFAARHAVSANDGYYQMVVLPSQVLDLSTRRKAVLLFDHETGLSGTTATDVLATAKNMLHNYYSPRDSFNLIFSNLTPTRASQVWLPCDSLVIEQAFQLGYSSIGLSNLPTLLADGISFLKQNGANGELVLMSNSDNYTQVSAANPLVNSLLAAMSPYTFRVSTANYTNTGVNPYWANGRYYYGNEYFASNLAALTGGSYFGAMQYSSYYSTTIIPFADVMTSTFSSLEGRLAGMDIQTDVQNGFCYSRFNAATNSITSLGVPYIQFGKYNGSMPLDVEISGSMNAVPFTKNVLVDQFYEVDTVGRAIWLGQYLRQLEAIANPDNQTKFEIIDSSLRSRVLTFYTAFLALEPSDTVTACSNCVDETGQTPGTTGLDDMISDSLTITALPNPFSGKVTLTLHMSAQTKHPALKIFNLFGQVVKEFAIDPAGGADITLEWSGTDLSGETVDAGIYLAVFETEHAKQTLKLVKQ